MRLDGSQQKRLTEALVEAFDEDSLARMVRYGLDERLSAIVGRHNFTHTVFELIEWARARGRLDELIIAARNENPTNVDLRIAAEELLLAAAEPKDVESIVLQSVEFSDVVQWRERMSQCELPVCRVEIPLGKMGTGFLLGSNIAMTNYHVIEDVIAKPALRDKVMLRFDYKTDSKGKKLKDGVAYKLLPNEHWLIASSPTKMLDYALLRVAGTPGQDSVGNQLYAVKRGWLTPREYKFEQEEPLLIIQHPQGEPLKITLGSVNKIDSQDYVGYTANTLGGSSGSPCFNSDWMLVALHHMGAYDGNEGVTFSAILADLQKEKLLGMLGK